MDRKRSSAAPVWLKTVTWLLAIGLAVVGIVLAVVSSSPWPLITFAGLAIPMVPAAAFRTTRTATADRRAYS